MIDLAGYCMCGPFEEVACLEPCPGVFVVLDSCCNVIAVDQSDDVRESVLMGASANWCWTQDVLGSFRYAVCYTSQSSCCRMNIVRDIKCCYGVPI